MSARRPLPEFRLLAAAVALATLLALALRTWGITGQVVLDDEWHAIHELARSSYHVIVRSFGLADHSIPLTLLYKAMADTLGLAEGRLRALQVACGTALVPVGAWLALRAGGDRAAAALTAFLIADAPFLVLWSRFARPYSVTVLLSVLCIAALWRWRTHRTRRAAAAATACAALAAWFHPLTAMYPALGWAFVFLEDAAAPSEVRARRMRGSVLLAVAMGAAALVLLAPPLIHDRRSLMAKAGGEHPDLETWERMLAIFWGGIPTPAMWAACAIAAWGAVVLFRRDRRLAMYLLALAIVPPVAVTLLGAVWVRQAQNLGRYVLPMQPLLLFFGALGAIDGARRVVRAAPQAAAWSCAGVLTAAYLAATPTILQVATLGPWYAHLDYHWDYRVRWNAAKRADPSYDPPEFYRELALMAPGTATVIEAPFTWQAPMNQLAYYATYHHQRELFGMVHSLCAPGDGRGEPPPRDRRFRFRLFVFLDDVDAVRNSGARYLVLLREVPHGKPFPESERCIGKLTQLYGPPVREDARAAVFDLRAGRAS